jgi:hypothetical protein
MGFWASRRDTALRYERGFAAAGFTRTREQPGLWQLQQIVRAVFGFFPVARLWPRHGISVWHTSSNRHPRPRDRDESQKSTSTGCFVPPSFLSISLPPPPSLPLFFCSVKSVCGIGPRTSRLPHSHSCAVKLGSSKLLLPGTLR